MARTWTPAQRSAFEERSRTLLVSAAAGSGKTSVLTERIIRSLCDTENPTDISRLLVVTFTRAAAGEMRARIAKALGDAIALHPDNEKLRRQLMLLSSAKISTIDSFYLDLVRANFEAAGFPPSFRMANEGELRSLKRDTMNESIDRMYAQHPEFVQVAELFSDVRTEQSLCDELLKVEGRLKKLPEQYEILLRSAVENEQLYEAPLHSPLGQVLFEDLKKTATEGLLVYESLQKMIEAEEYAALLSQKYGASFDEKKTVFRSVVNAVDAKDFDELQKLLCTPFERKAGRQKIPACSAEFAFCLNACEKFRDKWRGAVAEVRAFDRKELQESGQEMAELLRLIYLVLTDFDKAYTAAKREMEVAEFEDVSRAAYHLLVEKDGEPTPLALSLRETFDAIYIDEYQDVDAMQDATFRAIAKPRNRFMVGDIKQSIYSFRGADPDVFGTYRRELTDLARAREGDLPAATVFMSNCFRCDDNIVRFTNAVSGYLFSKIDESIGYTKEDDLVFSKDDPAKEGYCEPPCTVMIYEKSEQSEENAEAQQENPEAVMIVREIKRLLSGEIKRDGKFITPGDIAVLARKAAVVAPVAKLLKKEGIPVNDTSRENFFENPEVLCMYSLLAAIDNPFRDVYLAAVLRSPFFGFTLEELVNVRQRTDPSLSLYEAIRCADDALLDKALCERLKHFLGKLDLYRAKAELLPVDKLLRYLYHDTAVLSFSGNGEPSAQQSSRQNLLRLYEYARCFEAGGFKGLYRFVRYVEDLMQNNTKMNLPDGPRNAVSLVTIHHSKGLEYPVCFVAGAGRGFNLDDLNDPLLVNGKLGCGTRIPNIGAFSRADTFARESIKKHLKKLLLEEEMRILYVAMTRARERLYITADLKSSARSINKHIEHLTTPSTAALRFSANSYIEWILTALAFVPKEERSFYHIEYVNDEALLKKQEYAPPEGAASTKRELLTAKEQADLREELARRFDFTYPAAHLSQLPAKLSVSRLTPVVLDVYDTDAAPLDNGEAAEALLRTFERAPHFGKEPPAREADAAVQGTATHEFLQFCRFESAEKDLEQELGRLVESHFLPEDAGTLIRREELKQFFRSDFYKSLKSAKEIHRETRFNLFLPAADFTQNPELKAQLAGERLLVQGVIDLFFFDQNGKLILCDYKTDRLPPEAREDKARAAAFLFERHGTQLSYYKQALAAICGKLPDKTVIYSLPFGEALDEPLA